VYFHRLRGSRKSAQGVTFLQTDVVMLTGSRDCQWSREPMKLGILMDRLGLAISIVLGLAVVLWTLCGLEAVEMG
jgi:hypothetical protein